MSAHAEQKLSPTEATILDRVIEPEKRLPADVARHFLAMKFPAEDIDRINALSAKARAGTLTPAETEQLDGYLRIGHFLSTMKSKARMSLKKAPFRTKHGSRA